MSKGNGVLILVLGIISMTGFGCLAGIPAWVMGNTALQDIRSGRVDPSEEGMVQAGRVLGIISTVGTIAVVAFYLIVVLGVFGLAATQQHAR